jgi:hypothetical protein
VRRQAAGPGRDRANAARSGRVCVRCGGEVDAINSMTAALNIARETGNRDLEIEALNGVGEAVVARDPRAALEAYQRSLAIATEIGDRWQQARAFEGSVAPATPGPTTCAPSNSSPFSVFAPIWSSPRRGKGNAGDGRACRALSSGRDGRRAIRSAISCRPIRGWCGSRAAAAVRSVPGVRKCVKSTEPP